MLPDPLHPAVVHLPIALAILIPVLALLAVFAVRRRLFAPRLWGVIVLLQGLLVGSAWLAVETGEDQEERVEEIVSEQPVEAHEEAAERFLAVAGLGLLLAGAGLLPGLAGSLGRACAIAAFVGVLAAGFAVGRSGGELVYTHGAAAAYAQTKFPLAERGSGAHSTSFDRERGEEDHDEDEDD